MDALAQHEERAQHGILAFAEEMTVIRDQKLYPNANRSTDDGDPAWAAYCKGRWGMSKNYVDDVIQAAPVLARRSQTHADGMRISVGAAKRVATLDESVQDAIFSQTTVRDEVAVRAKAARNVAKAGLPVEAQIEAAAAVPVKPKKRKFKLSDSKLVRRLSPAVWHAEDAANFINSDYQMTDSENDYAWKAVADLRFAAQRIEERLYKPRHVRDWDDEAASILSEDA